VELIAGLIYVGISGLLLYAIYAHREQVTEHAREKIEQRLRILIESELIGICFWEAGGKITNANNTFLEMLNYSRADLDEGRLCWDKNLIPSEETNSGLAIRGKSGNYEKQLTRSDGSKIWAVVGAAPLESRDLYLGYALDVSPAKRAQKERDELKDQLRQAQKLQAVGQLAGGVAHDFNNILSVMVGYTSLLEGTLGETDERRYHTRQVLKSAGKASALIYKLLAFSRRQLLKSEILNLNSILEETGSILGRLIGEEVELTVSTSPELWPVIGDSTQLEQILINLAVNALDALPKGGKLHIRTDKTELSEDRARMFGIPPGRYVLLEVQDTGIGMSEETMSHIFEPFFTTKATGEGTGLGLAMVYGIVKQSGGHIHVESRLGHGTKFSIYIPAAPPQLDAADVSSSPDASAEAHRIHGPATILLAEDDEDVRELLADILESDGYKVINARDGEHAIALASEHQGVIHLLLTDVRMPHKSGTELAGLIREKYPTIKVIYMSGYVDDSLFRPEILLGANGILEKPVIPDVLLQRVRDVLSPEQ
jgi:PAS domain S-box-containing protein